LQQKSDDKSTTTSGECASIGGRQKEDAIPDLSNEYQRVGKGEELESILFNLS
jgi:hypothetical protein